MELKQEYVLEARRIIKTYHETIDAVNKFTDKLENTKANLLAMQKDVENLHTSAGTDLLKHKQTYDIMLKYETTINELHKILQPHVDSLEKIKKESKTLYTILLEKYPMYDEKGLQEQLFKQLDQLQQNEKSNQKIS